eukprot:PLAT12523.2.p1 GENE.PLAT12523.2~~PLAT12523.2.p1  ORF type:complete len:823 (+),score=111.43 PLAT12523.2:256-2469(+)
MVFGDGLWVHLAASISDEAVTLFANGEPAANVSLSSPVPARVYTNCQLMSRAAGDEEGEVSIAGFVMWPKALTKAEVSELRQEGADDLFNRFTCSCALGLHGRSGSTCSTCAAGHYGANCDQCSDRWCSGHGKCGGSLTAQDSCTCNAGWTSTSCETALSSAAGAEVVPLPPTTSTALTGVLLVIFAILCVLVAGAGDYWGHKRGSQADESREWFLSGTVFGVIDFGTDVEFIVNTQDRPALWVASLVFLLVNCTVSLAMYCRFLSSQLRDDKKREWIHANISLVATVMLLALMNPISLGLLSSGLFRWSKFEAPFDRRTRDTMSLFVVVSNLLEDIPQLVLRIISLDGAPALADAVAIASSLVMLSHGLIARGLLYMVMRSDAKSSATTSPSPELATPKSVEMTSNMTDIVVEDYDEAETREPETTGLVVASRPLLRKASSRLEDSGDDDDTDSSDDERFEDETKKADVHLPAAASSAEGGVGHPALVAGTGSAEASVDEDEVGKAGDGYDEADLGDGADPETPLDDAVASDDDDAVVDGDDLDDGDDADVDDDDGIVGADEDEDSDDDGAHVGTDVRDDEDADADAADADAKTHAGVGYDDADADTDDDDYVDDDDVDDDEGAADDAARDSDDSALDAGDEVMVYASFDAGDRHDHDDDEDGHAHDEGGDSVASGEHDAAAADEDSKAVDTGVVDRKEDDADVGAAGVADSDDARVGSADITASDTADVEDEFDD